MSVALLVLPDFFLIALGWTLRNRLNFSREFFAGTERLVYFVLFPALLFQSIMRVPITPGSAVDLLIVSASLVALGVALSWLAGPLFKPDAMGLASAAQCGFRFNTYLGLALSASLGGSKGQATMALLVGFSVPLANIAAVYGLARHNGARVLGEIVRNPLVLSTFLALVFNLAGVSLPGPAVVALDRMGAAAIPLGILCVGANLSWQGGTGYGRLIAWILSVKLLAMPLVGFALAWLLHLSGADRQIVVLFCALPTASAAYVLAMRMGGDGRMVALLVSLGTLISAVSIPIWLWLAA
jgi:malonate transporter